MRGLPAKMLLTTGWIGIQTAVQTAAVCFAETGTDNNTATPGSLAPGDSADIDFSSGVSAGDTFWMMFKVVFFLVIIIGVFFLIVKLIAQKNKLMTGRSLRSLGGLPLGQNKSIQVVEIGHSLYIVGVGENIQLLEKIEDAEEVAYLTDMMVSAPAFTGPAFDSVGDFLKKKIPLLGKRTKVEEEDVTDSFQHVFQNKMQGITDRKKLMEEMMKSDSKSDRLNDNHE